MYTAVLNIIIIIVVLSVCASSSDNSLVTRCAEELPWLLKRAELKEQLFHAILNMDVLLHLYSRYVYIYYSNNNVIVILEHLQHYIHRFVTNLVERYFNLPVLKDTHS